MALISNKLTRRASALSFLGAAPAAFPAIFVGVNVATLFCKQDTGAYARVRQGDLNT